MPSENDRGRDAQGKHTPGPWIAWNTHMGRVLTKWRISQGNTTPGIELPVATVEDYAQGDEQVANARLIAAAPELLEQLVAFCDLAEQWFGGNVPEEWRGRVECAKAAIRKAEGGVS